MTETDPKNLQTPAPSSSSSNKTPTETSDSHVKNNFSGQKVHYPNPPDATNPDPATLREQWKFATRQYSRWYAHAWGTAILAGVSFFALGWIIKGSNPLPSFKDESPSHTSSSDTADEAR
ncbi:Casein kinase substrate, phosphoprotein PP28 [Quillaja saponaria]|uniref:Casein kinase substrate, phosphoprotein PP28 n=1 Tax=Quillaja saponaria TaxID=32244 RepID=A0AAD7KWE1_QUISA|nr:Casein kinase substrate, phosphoprotein PP28 [Quillaja saponaria]KAJ7947046.1 Casein kinase substrate, phosphoprotein PP28 [Quillaja saponaria]